jgi:hypothetical protein
VGIRWRPASPRRLLTIERGKSPRSFRFAPQRSAKLLCCGFMAGTGKLGNWKSPITMMTLILPLSPSLPSSTLSTRNRNTRPLWSSMIPARGTIRLKSPDSGFPDYQVELGGSRSGNRGEPSDSGAGWFSVVSPSSPTTVPPAIFENEALVASLLDDFARLHHATDKLLSRRMWCGSAPQPPTLEPLAPAISISTRSSCYAQIRS